MKQYEVTLTGHFEKTVSIYADSPEQAAEKLKIILFDTDLVRFSDGDFVCGEADIKDEMRTDVKKWRARAVALRMRIVPTVRTSAPCAENVCMRAKIKDTSYQALNLVIHLPMETKFAC